MEIDGRAIRGAIGITNGCLYFSTNRRYALARINLVKAGSPAEVLEDSRYDRLHQSIGMPIVVEKNRRKFGYVAATDYCPRAIVVCGTAKRSKLLAEGSVKGWAWVEKGALSIQADDCISSQELMDKLQVLLSERYVKILHASSALPRILALYPFENYLIFGLNGQRFRQPYNLDPVSRSVGLAGQSLAVKEQFVDAGRDFMAETCRRWSNPKEALSMYCSDVKTGIYRLKCPGGQVPGREGAIFQLLASQNLSYADFVLWSCSEFRDNSYKTVNGKKLPRHKFKALDKWDKSTWIPLIRRARA